MKEYTVQIHDDGSQHWYMNGKRHREDGPAVILVNGQQEWFNNGKLHREDGPAVIYPDGTQKWYKNGKIFDPETEPLLGKQSIIDGVSSIYITIPNFESLFSNR